MGAWGAAAEAAGLGASAPAERRLGPLPVSRDALSKLSANFIKLQALGLAPKSLSCDHPACPREPATCPIRSARPGPGRGGAPLIGLQHHRPVPGLFLLRPPASRPSFSPTGGTRIFSASPGVNSHVPGRGPGSQPASHSLRASPPHRRRSPSMWKGLHTSGQASSLVTTEARTERRRQPQRRSTVNADCAVCPRWPPGGWGRPGPAPLTCTAALEWFPSASTWGFSSKPSHWLCGGATRSWDLEAGKVKYSLVDVWVGMG